MRFVLRPLGLVCLLALSACGTDEGERFIAALNGTNEVPSMPGVLSSGLVEFSASGDHINYNITVQNITSVTGVQIHSGAAGTIGPAVADLYTGPTTGAIASGTLTAGAISASSLSALSLDSLKALMRAGQAYVNVRTTTSPNGEIRGQIVQN